MRIVKPFAAALFALSLPTAKALATETISSIFQTDAGESRISGFITPVAKYTRMLNQDATLYGGRAGATWNQSIILGGGAYGLRSKIRPEDDPNQRELDFAYAALVAGYDIRPDKLFHGAVLANYGWGKAGLSSGTTSATGEPSQDVDDKITVFEPELLAELNVSQFLRIGVGGSYRWVYGMDLTELDEQKLEGWTTTLAVNFGGF